MTVLSTAVVAAEETLLELFTRYNTDLWPLHLVAYGIGVVMVASVLWRPGPATDRMVTVLLAGLWGGRGSCSRACTPPTSTRPLVPSTP